MLLFLYLERFACSDDFIYSSLNSRFHIIPARMRVRRKGIEHFAAENFSNRFTGHSRMRRICIKQRQIRREQQHWRRTVVQQELRRL